MRQIFWSAENIPPHHRPRARTEASSVPFFLDGKAEAYVGAGSLVFFSPRLNGQLKQDVIYSSLLAQLAANKKHNRFNEIDDWYTFYSKIMINLDMGCSALRVSPIRTSVQFPYHIPSSTRASGWLDRRQKGTNDNSERNFWQSNESFRCVHSVWL